MKREIERHPDSPRVGEEDDRQSDGQTDRQRFLPDELQLPDRRAEDQQQGGAHADELGHDEIDRVRAEEVPLFPLEADAAARTALPQGEMIPGAPQ
jgi:hypothetical protein